MFEVIAYICSYISVTPIWVKVTQGQFPVFKHLLITRKVLVIETPNKNWIVELTYALKMAGQEIPILLPVIEILDFRISKFGIETQNTRNISGTSIKLLINWLLNNYCLFKNSNKFHSHEKVFPLQERWIIFICW